LLAPWPTSWGLSPIMCAPAYEDPAEWILKEGNLPDNVTPENSKLKDPEERNRIATGLRARADRAGGLCSADPALAVEGAGRAGARSVGRRGAARCSWCRATARWATACRWARCPMCRRREYPYTYVTDPTERSAATRCPIHDEAGARNALRPRPAGIHASRSPSFTAAEAGRGADRAGAWRSAAPCAPRSRSSRATGGSACSCRRWRTWRITSTWSPRPRSGRELGLPVHIEGYGPPHDPRLNVIRVAPDPGVIEVNIHPAHSWDDCKSPSPRASTRRRGLPPGRRQVHDRRAHTGTGGGNHVVVGGATPNSTARSCGARTSAEIADPALAAASVSVLPVLGPVHRADQPGAADRRGAARHALRAGDRAGADPAIPDEGAAAALAGGPAACATC
jgi:hypothetical protein